MIKSFPRTSKAKGVKPTDIQLAKVGDLNQLVKDINRTGYGASSPTGIPNIWYPPAGLTVGGPKFTYTDGSELISYHIKGITVMDNMGTGFEQYLCTVRFPNGAPFLLPGTITGMFLSGYEANITTSPLANGGLVELDGVHVPVSDFQITFYNYGQDPQVTGYADYALVMSGTVPNSGYITGQAMYDFEFLLFDNAPVPTIYQD